MSTIRSSVPPSYLDEHPPARLALSGSSAGEGVSAEAGAAGTGGDWKEDVVQGVVGGLGWLSTSGVSPKHSVFLSQGIESPEKLTRTSDRLDVLQIPTNIYHFLVFLTQAVIDLASRLKLGEMCLLLLTAGTYPLSLLGHPRGQKLTCYRPSQSPPRPTSRRCTAFYST